LQKGLGTLTVKLRDWIGPRRRLLLLSLSIAAGAGLVLFLLLRLLLQPPKPVPDLYEQGRALYQDGNYSSAIETLRREALQHPTRQEARLLLAQSFVALHQWSAAQGYLKERLVALPQDGPAIYWLGRALYGAGRTAEAERSWQALLDRNEPLLKSRAGLALADMHYKLGDYDLAARLLYQALVTHEPLEPAEEQQAHYLYGLLLARDQRFEDAITQLQQATEIKANSLWAKNGPLQNRLEQTSEHARPLLSNLPQVAKEKLEVVRRAKLAYALVLAEEYGPAEEHLAQVLKLVPNFVDARAYIGLVYWRTGRVSQAITALTYAINQEPKNRLARQTLAEIYTERVQNFQPELGTTQQTKTESEQARRLLESLLSERPEDVLLLVDMARLYVALREYDLAEGFYYLAIKANKDKPVIGVNPEAMLTRFYAETGFDPCKRGLMAGGEVVKNVPQDAESWYSYGLAYAFCHKPAEAALQLEKALSLRPNWPAATYRLALAYQEMGRQTEATILFAHTSDLDPATNWSRP